MTLTNNINVLLITEGTYPYSGGGVSTWAHDLCTKTRGIDFTLYSINAGVEVTPKYPLSKNVKNIIQVPMWSPEEPFDCVDYNIKYSAILKAREFTSDDIITSSFVPNFKSFIEEIYSENQSLENVNASFYKMWRFFQKYDYKTTMTSEAVWYTFCDVVSQVLPPEELNVISLEDMTTAMRWIYRFLIPMAIEVPKMDISHITISGIAVIPALVLKYKYNTPILVTEHGVFIRERLIAISAADYSYFLKKMLINFSECITKLVYSHASKISTVSKFNMSWEKFYGAELSKIEVIYNGVDENVFIPRPKPEHLKNIPTVVAAARIFDLKDILTMIKSCNEVVKTIPNVQYLIYGNKDAVPEYTIECEELIKELKLENNFFLKGFHNKPELIYSEGDISILTSISEGFPFTVIESMSSGIPVVATDVGGVTEAIDDTCGLVCKPKDHKEIAQNVIKLLHNEKLRKGMGENARQKVLENFTIETFINSFEKTYQNLSVKTTSLIENQTI
ncbi:GT4 family glycosyltransferase PelF [Maribacter sp.]|uniref:GT4 family glycosyltransferase PelF n=1 Tax=Maribacter sp. TaxID=1897614 RepID=UPI0025BD2BD9|nr:GT4 family glycosyltransferase PelF [Maribacter sp.]